MPLSTDVILPLEHEPVWPPVCCRCLADRADYTVQFAGRRFSWWQVLFVWLWWTRKPVRHEVPCCVDCRPRIRQRKVFEFFAYVGLVVLALAIVMPWLQSIGASRQWQKLGVFAAVMILGIPFFIWTTVRPPAFDLTVREDKVEFEFGNERYARMFADSNPGYRSDDLDWEEEFEREWREEHGDDDGDDDEWDDAEFDEDGADEDRDRQPR